MVKVVSMMDMSEKDIICLLFFGSVFSLLFIAMGIESAVKWYKRNRRYHFTEFEYIRRVAVAPVLSLILRANNIDPEERKRRVAQFIYDY